MTFADEAEIVAKPAADRVLAASAIDRAAVGFGATRYRAALSAAVAGARRPPRHHRRRHRSAGERLGRRRSRVGAGERRRSKSLDVGAAAAEPRGDRRCGRSPIGWSPPCDNAGAAGARRARASDHRRSSGGRRHRAASARISRPTRPLPGRRAARRRRSPSTIADGIQADNVRYAVLRRRRPPVGAGRHRQRRCSAATRSTCSRRSPPGAPRRRGVPGDRRQRRAAVGVDRAIAWRRTPRCCCCRRAGSSGADASARVVRAQRRRPADRRRTRRRRRRRRRRARAGSTLRVVTVTGRQAGAARARAGRRPPSGVSAFRGERSDARAGDVPDRRPASAAPRARRWRDSRPAKRRCSSVPRATDARSCSRRISTTAGTTSRCTRASCRSCTKRCAILAARVRMRSSMSSPMRRPAAKRTPGIVTVAG